MILRQVVLRVKAIQSWMVFFLFGLFAFWPFSFRVFLLYPQLLPHFHRVCILLLHGDGFAAVFVYVFAFLCEERAKKIVRLRPADGRYFLTPTFPAEVFIILLE